LTEKGHRVPSIGLHSNGTGSPIMVRMNSDTVGWMCIARCMTVKGVLRVHDVENAVNDFVTRKLKQRHMAMEDVSRAVEKGETRGSMKVLVGKEHETNPRGYLLLLSMMPETKPVAE
jgi:hypothetical protein